MRTRGGRPPPPPHGQGVVPFLSCRRPPPRANHIDITTLHSQSPPLHPPMLRRSLESFFDAVWIRVVFKPCGRNGRRPAEYDDAWLLPHNGGAIDARIQSPARLRLSPHLAAAGTPAAYQLPLTPATATRVLMTCRARNQLVAKYQGAKWRAAASIKELSPAAHAARCVKAHFRHRRWPRDDWTEISPPSRPLSSNDGGASQRGRGIPRRQRRDLRREFQAFMRPARRRDWRTLMGSALAQ